MYRARLIFEDQYLSRNEQMPFVRSGQIIDPILTKNRSETGKLHFPITELVIFLSALQEFF